MKLLFSITFFFTLCLPLLAQHNFRVIVKEADGKEPLVGVSTHVRGLAIGARTDTKGYAEIKNVPPGRQTILFDYIGYRKDSLVLFFPLNSDSIFHIFLDEGLEMNEVIISASARNGNRVEDQPLKIEVLGTEEVDEKTAMKPANISMMLTEYTGVQAQRTSVSSGNINVKIHGLDGRYTQILKDGFPIYTGMAEGLSLMQTPPLDLKQAEIIKGSSSTLYGGDAIGGVINLISREPDTTGSFSAILNQTSRQETDISTFYQKRKSKLGFTLLATGSRQNALDINGDGFTDLPQSQQFTFTPKLFYYFNDSTKLTAGLSYSYDNRAGGDINVVNNLTDSAKGYFQRSLSNRSFSELKFEKKLRHGDYLTLKNSVTYFERSIFYPDISFSGTQTSSYSEASYLKKLRNNDLVGGVNLLTDHFIRQQDTGLTNQSYSYYTTGVFIQDNWQINKLLSSQAGFRFDHHNVFGNFYLPQLALLFHINQQLYARASYGQGYKIPSVFNVQTSDESYEELTILSRNMKPEKSDGVNIDLTYKGTLDDDVSFAITQSAFYNAIHHPVVPVYNAIGNYGYINAGNDVVTKGLETNINSYFLRNFNFAAGYTYTDASRLYDKTAPVLPLTARHSLMLDMMYYDHKWKVGAESYYIGQQYLTDGSTRPDYWLLGFLVARNIKNFVFTLNFENLLNVKQTSYEAIYTGSREHPEFKELWAPLDGLVTNASVRINF